MSLKHEPLINSNHVGAEDLPDMDSDEETDDDDEEEENGARADGRSVSPPLDHPPQVWKGVCAGCCLSLPPPLPNPTAISRRDEAFSWFQSKLLHVYFNITNKDRYV